MGLLRIQVAQQVRLAAAVVERVAQAGQLHSILNRPQAVVVGLQRQLRHQLVVLAVLALILAVRGERVQLQLHLG